MKSIEVHAIISCCFAVLVVISLLFNTGFGQSLQKYSKDLIVRNLYHISSVFISYISWLMAMSKILGQICCYLLVLQEKYLSVCLKFLMSFLQLLFKGIKRVKNR